MHIAWMEAEVVERRRWLSRQHFLDLVGATNLIPGPNSTEMALHIGHLRAGWPGFLGAGLVFILPAALITTALAVLYVEWGTLPEVVPWLFGIKPTMIAVIAAAVWRLGHRAVRGYRTAVIGAGVLAASLLDVDAILALIGGSLLGMLWLKAPAGFDPRRWKGLFTATAFLPALVGVLNAPSFALPAILMTGGVAAAGAVSLADLGLFFLKVGAVLYGSGYVLAAFLEGTGWLSQEQLLDAIAVGQFTPGPVFSTATFVGYVVGGAAGAVVATVAIFFPSFVFVAALTRVLPHLRRSTWSAAFLDAVNVSAVALMLAVVVQLGDDVLTAWPAWVIAGAAGLVVALRGLNPAWLVLGGALLGRALWPWAG